ncbi:MAG: hypothetical protein LIP00_05005 [Parabacteroides sp.]|nr:hypothetical protein [Parabacteroides sp.]
MAGTISLSWAAYIARPVSIHPYAVPYRCLPRDIYRLRPDESKERMRKRAGRRIVACSARIYK